MNKKTNHHSHHDHDTICCNGSHHHDHGEHEHHHEGHKDECCCGQDHDDALSDQSHSNQLMVDSNLMISELLIEGLHCSNCATKIERQVSSLEEIKEAVLNFATSTLIIKTNRQQKDTAIKKAVEIAENAEPGISVKVKQDEDSIIKEFALQGLNCASCAEKIKKNVSRLEGILGVELNFATSTLKVQVDHKYEKTIGEKITKIVVDLEPEVKVIEKNEDAGKEEQEKTVKNSSLLTRIGISLGLLGIGLIFKKQSWSVVPYLLSYFIIGLDIIKRSFNNIKRGEVFDENFLMTVATLAAIWTGEYPEAIMVMLLYQVGEYFQGRAVESSRKSIASLMDIRPEYANLKVGNDIQKVSPNNVKVGDIIIVKPGEKVPLDGVIIEGASSVDTKALTGESVPQNVEAGDNITSGFINIDGLLSVKVTKGFKESAVSKILDLVQNASAKKAKTELRITKFAKYYTPVVVSIAVLTAILPPLLMKGQNFNDWILRAATFLVVSCPCALVISIPMTYFAGLGASSKKGILIKGGNYLEALSKAEVLVFDKTGTLTEGKFKVDEIVARNGISEEELLRLTAYAESFSTHPIATSIVKAYNAEINQELITDYKETKGKGISANIEGLKVMSGNIKFLRENGINVEETQAPGTVVYTAINNQYAGYIVIQDQIKMDSPKAIEGFKDLDIKDIIMLTGDRKMTADAVAKQLGIENYRYELLPNQKVEEVEKLIEGNKDGSLVFVGDGINDAPVLARADVGVAMGGVGSDAAIEAADVVIMNDEPSKLIDAIRISRKTKKIVDQNISLSISVKLIIMFFAFFGLVPMWLAVFGDVGVSIIAVFNAMRVLRY